MHKRLTAAVFAAILFFSLTSCSGKPRYITFSEEVFAKGITFSAMLMGGDELSAGEEMSAFLNEVNSDMSLTLSSSALTAFNNSTVAGGKEYSEPVQVSKSTYEVVLKALEIAKKTYGAFNIAVSPLSSLWKLDAENLDLYGGIYKRFPAPPAYAETQRVKADCQLFSPDGTPYVQAYPSDGKYYLIKSLSGLKLDLGAIAKGYSADGCVEILKKHNVESALIDISGNLCLYGKWYRNDLNAFTDWSVNLLSPRPLGNSFAPLLAIRSDASGSFVTSGDYQRFGLYFNGDASPLLFPHILNASTGLPIGIGYNEVDGYYNVADKLAENKTLPEGDVIPVISATVIGVSSTEADAYATAMCVMGYEKAKLFMKENNMQGILVSGDGRIALINIAEQDNGKGITLTQNEKFNAYLSYKIEEI